jgi:hypothetical protein
MKKVWTIQFGRFNIDSEKACRKLDAKPAFRCCENFSSGLFWIPVFARGSNYAIQ